MGCGMFSVTRCATLVRCASILTVPHLFGQDACDLAMKPGIYGDHHKMAKAVAQEAIKKDSHDNTSALVFMFTWNRDGLAAVLKAEKAAKKKIKAKVVDMFEDSD